MWVCGWVGDWVGWWVGEWARVGGRIMLINSFIAPLVLPCSTVRTVVVNTMIGTPTLRDAVYCCHRHHRAT